MEEASIRSTDVLIVGAGPTGLMMACQLAFFNIPFIIIDRQEASQTGSGALIVQARSLEIFQKLGIAEEAISKGIIAGKASLFFNGKKIGSLQIQNFGENLTQFPFLLLLEQNETEKILTDFITGHGFTVERKLGFKRFTQEEGRINTQITDENGTGQTISSKFLIAADGANSSIRKFLQVPTYKKTFTQPFFSLDCSASPGLADNEIGFVFSRKAVAGFFPLKNLRWRIDGSIPPKISRLKKISYEAVAGNLSQRIRMNVGIKWIEKFSISRSHHKNAAAMRVGNCFFAGDAAHVMTPVGAQGMNTGLQDAHNLAWKLAFVINKFANPEILQSYEQERLRVAEPFSRMADFVFSLLTGPNIFFRFFRFSFLKYLLSLVIFILKKNHFRNAVFKSLSQINKNYRSGILSKINNAGDFQKGSPLPGDRLPFIEFTISNEKTSAHKLLDPKLFNLFILSDGLPSVYSRLAEEYTLNIVLIPLNNSTGKLFHSFGLKDSGYFLVRPDGFIALRSAGMDPSNLIFYLNDFLINNRQPEKVYNYADL